MWGPETKQVHVSRDIIWLNKIYFNKTTEWINVPRNNFTSNNDYDSNNVQLENEKTTTTMKMKKQAMRLNLLKRVKTKIMKNYDEVRKSDTTTILIPGGARQFAI
jgi:hypothetical protein